MLFKNLKGGDKFIFTGCKNFTDILIKLKGGPVASTMFLQKGMKLLKEDYYTAVILDGTVVSVKDNAEVTKLTFK